MTSSPSDELAPVAETALKRLVTRGYRFVHPRDAAGNVVTVVGVRAHDTVTDVVRIEAEDEVTASRIPADESDILDPGTVLWQRSGPIGDVVRSVLALAESDYARQDTGRSRGYWVQTAPTRTRFVSVS